jgi:ketosteroid isomerase-like protein
MTKWILFLLSATILPAAKPDAKTEKDVLAAMDAYKQALIKKDAAALSRVLSDDLIYTHSSNLHEDKAAVLASLKKPATTEAIDFKNLSVRLYGNTAVVVGDVDFTNNPGTGAATTKLNVLHVLVKGPQGWQLVARQATRYPEATSARK